MSEFSPKVSIVLPTFNGERYLRGAIESCLAQSHRNLELVVVDDCSTDRTPEIVRSIIDPRVVCIRNQRNQGLPRSLNIGFARTTGEYLSWTSDDNEYAPTAIEEMLRALRAHPDTDFVYADYTAVFESTGQTEARKLPDQLALDQSNTIGACFLYARRVYGEIGDFDPLLALGEDYDYWIRVWKRFRMRRLARDLYLYRYHSTSLTATKLLQVQVVDAVLKYRHGFISSVALMDGLARHAFTAFNEHPRSESLREVVQMISRVGRVSPTLAVRFASIMLARWGSRKLRSVAALRQ